MYGLRGRCRMKFKRSTIIGISFVILAIGIIVCFCIQYISYRNDNAQGNVIVKSFGEGHYDWKTKDDITIFSIPEKNINICSFYVSEDEKILLQNYHIKQEEDESGAVISNVGNFLYEWTKEDKKFNEIICSDYIDDNYILLSDEKLVYLRTEGDNLGYYSGDILDGTIKNIVPLQLEDEEIYLDRCMALYDNTVFFSGWRYSYENLYYYMGTINGNVICDIKKADFIDEEETVEKISFLGSSRMLLMEIMDGDYHKENIIIELSDTDKGVDAKRTIVGLGFLDGDLRSISYICAHKEQDIIYYMDDDNTIYKTSLSGFIEKSIEEGKR